MHARGQPLALLSFDPLPDLVFSGCVYINDKVLVRMADHLMLDLAQHPISGDRTLGIRPTDEDPHAALFNEWSQHICGTLDGNSGVGAH